MRWKLLLISALLAALAGAGASFAVAHYVLGATRRLTSPDSLTALAFLPPLAATTYAGVFVYRRTARRRILQAVLTALLSLALTFGALSAASAWVGRARELPPAPTREMKNAV